MGPKGTVRWYAPDPEKEKAIADKALELPPSVQVLYEKFDAFGLYLLEETNHIVTWEGCSGPSCGHQITFKVGVRREFNPGILSERDVFGIDPRSLKPLTVEEVEEHVRTEEPADPKIAKAMEDPNFRREFYKKVAEELGIGLCDCNDPRCEHYTPPKGTATS